MYKTLLLCLCLMPVVAYAADDDKKDNDKKDNEKKTEQTKDKKKNWCEPKFLTYDGTTFVYTYNCK